MTIYENEAEAFRAAEDKLNALKAEGYDHAQLRVLNAPGGFKALLIPCDYRARKPGRLHPFYL